MLPKNIFGLEFMLVRISCTGMEQKSMSFKPDQQLIFLKFEINPCFENQKIGRRFIGGVYLRLRNPLCSLYHCKVSSS